MSDPCWAWLHHDDAPDLRLSKAYDFARVFFPGAWAIIARIRNMRANSHHSVLGMGFGASGMEI